MKPSILIVDDDPDVRMILRTALGQNFNVLEADDGTSGLAEVLTSEQKIDLIITDLRMPDMNGIEFIEKLPTKIPFVIISGFLYDSEYSDKLEELSPAAVLKKPFQLVQLREIILSCINPSESNTDKKARILVIDDEESIRIVVQKMLEREGYEVLQAENGQAGLDLFRENPTEMVITDMFMPVKSGLEVIQELRREFPELKIIAMSAFGVREEPDMVTLSEKYGASAAFEKPFRNEEFLEAVKSLLEG